MELTKEVIIDKYEVVGPYKHVQCRQATVISEDGVELSRTFHRCVISPGDDVSGESAETQAIVAAVHTQEIKDAYAAHLAEQQPKVT
jgi:hypothetical protein